MRIQIAFEKRQQRSCGDVFHVGRRLTLVGKYKMRVVFEVHMDWREGKRHVKAGAIKLALRLRLEHERSVTVKGCQAREKIAM